MQLPRGVSSSAHLRTGRRTARSSGLTNVGWPRLLLPLITLIMHVATAHTIRLGAGGLGRLHIRARMLVAAASTSSISSSAEVPSKLCLIDAHNLAYRMFFGIKPLTARDGHQVHAVLGFCNKLLQLHTLFPEHAFLAVFDKGGSASRNELLPSYKATRAAMPYHLQRQIDLIYEAATAFGLPTLSERGYEADDVIATCVAGACLRRVEAVTIVTTDKDMLQLVSPDGAGTSVRVYDDKKKKLIDAPGVRALYGVDPQQFADYLALVGDSSDNVPGVPGVGPKTAAKLLTEFGDLEAVLQAATTMKKSKRQEALVEFAEQARLSQQLVALQSDVPGICENVASEGEMPRRASELPLLRPFLQKLDFVHMERRLYGAASLQGLTT